VDPVIKSLGEENALRSILALDVARHTGSCARYGTSL
jgi:hypothetical protein